MYGADNAYLNSFRRAFMASLAFVSLAEARSHTSSTRDQSSDEVAVRYPAEVSAPMVHQPET